MIPFYSCKPESGELRIYLDSIEAILNDGVSVGGPRVESFEKKLAAYLGVRHCVGVGNGLDALTLALMALGVGEGDEVLVPSYTFIATWIAVSRVGATVVAVDIDPSTGLIDIEQITVKLTSRTKAFIPVHLYGVPVDFSPLSELLVEREIAVIEDCAQAIGAEIGGRKVGTLGDAGAFSFYPTKNLGGFGDGGVVSTNLDSVAEKIRSLRSYGFAEDRYSFREIGLNTRLDTLNAGLLELKLPRLDQDNNHRRVQAGQYFESLETQGHWLPRADKFTSSVFHHFPVLVESREDFRQTLLRLGVQTDMHYPYTIESFAKLADPKLVRFSSRDVIGARRWASEVVTLPIGPWMSEDMTLEVKKAIRIALAKPKP